MIRYEGSVVFGRVDVAPARQETKTTHEKLDSRPSLRISGLTYSGVPTNDRARGRPCGSARNPKSPSVTGPAAPRKAQKRTIERVPVLHLVLLQELGRPEIGDLDSHVAVEQDAAQDQSLVSRRFDSVGRSQWKPTFRASSRDG